MINFKKFSQKETAHTEISFKDKNEGRLNNEDRPIPCLLLTLLLSFGFLPTICIAKVLFCKSQGC